MIDRGKQTLQAPELAASTLIAQWDVRTASDRVLIPSGAKDTIRQRRTETGFTWLAQPQHRNGLFGFIALIFVAGFFRLFRLTHILSGIGFIAAVVISYVWMKAGFNKVLPTDSGFQWMTTGIDAANGMAISFTHKSHLWAHLSLTGLLAGLLAMVAFGIAMGSRKGMRWLWGGIGCALTGLACLYQRPGAGYFFIGVTLLLLVLFVIPDLIRFGRFMKEFMSRPPAKGWNDDDQKSDGESSTTEGDQQPPGSPTSPSVAGLLLTIGLVFASSQTELQASKPAPTPVPAPVELSAAQKIKQTATWEKGRLTVDATILYAGKKGDAFMLLKAPGILTKFDGAGIRLVRHGAGATSAYLAILEKSGELNANMSYEMAVATLPADVMLLTGAASVHQIDITLKETGWTLESQHAVQRRITSTKTMSGASFLMRPFSNPSFSVKPRARNLDSENARFYTEVANLYLPKAGVIDAVYQVDIRPSQGRIGNVSMNIPKGFTVGDVTGPLRIWQFDPSEQRLSVALEPAQSQPFSLLIYAQHGAPPLPYSMDLFPLEVIDSAGGVGRTALAFGPMVRAEEVTGDGMGQSNLTDFNQALLANQPAAKIRRVFRYSSIGKPVTVKVGEVLPEIRSDWQTRLHIGEERNSISTTLGLEILRAGIFTFQIEVPNEMEIESFAGASLSQWSESKADGKSYLDVTLAGQTIGNQAFSLSMVSTGLQQVTTWNIPQFHVTEAKRETGELVIVPDQGIRVRPQTRSNVSLLDARDLGINETGALAFKLLQQDWNLEVAIEKLDPWITVDALQDVTVREGRVRTRMGMEFRVRNAAIKSIRVEIPGLDDTEIDSMRASGEAVSDIVRDPSAPDMWTLHFRRRVIGKVPAVLEYQRILNSADPTLSIQPPKIPQSRQVNLHLALRSAGRLELGIQDEDAKGVRRTEWNAVPKTLQATDRNSAPDFILRMTELDTVLPIRIIRHNLANTLKMNVISSTLTTSFSSGSGRISTLHLNMNVVGKSNLPIILPAGATLYNAFVNGESAAVVREGDAILLQVERSPFSGNATSVEITYNAPSSGGWLKELQLEAPRLPIPLENLSWSVVLPDGVSLESSSGDLAWSYRNLGQGKSLQQYLDSLARLRNDRVAKADRLLQQAQGVLQRGSQEKARHMLSNIAYSQNLDQASNEDARIQLEELETRQALLRLNTRRQKLVLESRDAREDASGPLAEAARRNPLLQGRLEYRPEDFDTFLIGNSALENATLRRLARRLIGHQIAAIPAPDALTVNIPQQGMIETFVRNVQVRNDQALRLNLSLKRRGTTGTGSIALCFLLLSVLGMGFCFLAKHRPARKSEQKTVTEALNITDLVIDSRYDLSNPQIPSIMKHLLHRTSSFARNRPLRQLMVWIGLALFIQVGHADPYEEARQSAKAAEQNGNYKEAYDLYLGYVEKPDVDKAKLANDFQLMSLCLASLNRINELDPLIAKLKKAHPENWRLKLALATNLQGQQHVGYLVKGEFNRGYSRRGSNPMIGSAERDRVRGLKHMEEAMFLAMEQKVEDRELADLCIRFASILQGTPAWKLQHLTDLTVLPPYEELAYGSPYGRGRRWGGSMLGAPVDAEGNPIFHQLPDTWDAAKSDGERWRWLLDTAAQKGMEKDSKTILARFSLQQFGVQTMANGMRGFMGGAGANGKPSKDGPFSVTTLKKTETIARLATGIKRFDLPEDFNYITLFNEIGNHYQVGDIYANRRQYPKAVKKFQKADTKQANERIKMITGNWGQFETTPNQVSGEKAAFDFKFRNGEKVHFTAKRIKIDTLLADVKRYLKSNPERVAHQIVNMNNIGMKILNENKPKYLGEVVKRWSLDLDPFEDHFDQLISVETDLEKTGGYYITAKMAGGNTTYMSLWLNDTVMVKKALASKDGENGPAMYYFADAKSGKALPDMTVDFFGYWGERLPKAIGKRYHNIKTITFTDKTDEHGLCIPPTKTIRPDDRYSPDYLITAKSKTGHVAFHGFSGVWNSRYYDNEYNATKIFGITDRPVYRPNQTVEMKAWARHAQYDKDNNSEFAEQAVTLRLRNPKGDEIQKVNKTFDAWGGVTWSYALPDETALGTYSFEVYTQNKQRHRAGSFRVEEYKKPEFEVVIDAPTKPVMLGEKVEATIKADYYFGEPVAQAKVKYKITRTSHSKQWYAPMEWDWFYGNGYWWFSYDYNWYPNFRSWGCIRPFPWWGHRPNPQPEVIADAEVEIGQDGTVKIEIDTAVAKAMHSNTDHKYSITAEVTDQSRRTIVGQGTILVAREPYKVNVWISRGYGLVGEDMQVNIHANTLDGKPVQGKGTLRLMSIRYDDDRVPIEKEMGSWELDTDPEGNARQQIKAGKAGQYRLVYTLTDEAGHTQEGGYVMIIRGTGFDGADFRFNDLELVPEKSEYAPGETLKLMVNTDREDATVLLFIRPANGTYLKPQVISMKGKSMIEAIDIVKKDLPNFFIEALTVSDGRVHVETKEIIVPPEKRVLNVEVIPNKASYQPGEEATMKIKLTDFFGEPFEGSSVVTVYDKAVEYISGGSNVSDIKEFFWKWRRRHRPQTEDNVSRYGHALVKRGDTRMLNIGALDSLVPIQNFNSKNDSGLVDSDSIGAPKIFAASAPRMRVAKASRSIAQGMAMDNVAESMSLGALTSEGRLAGQGIAGEAQVQATLAEANVRSSFADTAFWAGELKTNAKGEAEINFTMPDNLTGWKVKTWAMGHGTKVGHGETLVVTKKNLMLRMQAPRFFTETDTVTISANIHNYLETEKSVRAVLELEGSSLTAEGSANQDVMVPAGGEVRVDWTVRVAREGEAMIRMKALTDVESDAMEMSYPVYVHGMLKTESYSRVIRPDETKAEIKVVVPAERRVDQSQLEIRYSPTLAGAMVDALPYLIDVKYRCTEQTLNRFLPAVLTQKILTDMDLDLAAIKAKRTNLNAQEIGDDTKRAAQWKRYKRNPVFDEKELEEISSEGLKKLLNMQLKDGGWGWFSGARENSSAYTTCYIMHGLQLARGNDLKVNEEAYNRGVSWLLRHQKERVKWIKEKRKTRTANNLDAFVFMVLTEADERNAAMEEFLWEDKSKHLSPYGKSILGLAYDKLNEVEKRDELITNISQFLVIDDENQSAWLNIGNSWGWWSWYGNEIETQAYFLKLLSRTDQKGDVASGLVKYLLNNRKHATYWQNSRDTSIAIEAIAEYLKASGENKPNVTVEVLVDGRLVKEETITAKNLFQFDNKVILKGDALSSGEHTIELRKKGDGPLYANAYLTNFTLEDFITKAGLEIKVERSVYKLIPEARKALVQGDRGQAIEQNVEGFKRIKLKSGAELTSGDLIEVELEIESKNDYEYLVFEDIKAAGFEPVDVRSGYQNMGMSAYVEYRDERVNFFVKQLARGPNTLRYRLKAEIPGQYSAMPTKAWAMYAPELKANSDEIKLSIKDTE